ncbi:MAG: hypothetical protein QOE11_907 [Solirubrobacteraceae bacterium]|nr:hypothetical protein [Solirubrobacteraceae bacterium]
MSERLQSRLAELAREVEFPPTPDLAGALQGRIEARGRPRRRPLRRTVALALSLALLGAGGAVAAVPAARHAIGDLLGLRGATVQRVPRLPAAPARAGRDLGERTTLAAARRRAGFDPVAAHDPRLGSPESVHLARTAGGEARVSLVYDRGAVTLTEVRGSTAPDLVRKLTPPQTAIRSVHVRSDEPGVYLDGSHVVMYLDASGRVVQDRARRAGRVLLWQRGPLLLRLEGAPGEARALQIARSVR